jgi:hypothetical protein
VPTLPTRFLVDTEQQAADLCRPLAAVDIAADHELLPQLALELEPGLAAARNVGRIGPLGDHALQLQLPGRGQDGRRVGLEIRAVAHRLLRLLFKQGLEQSAAIGECRLAQVVAREEREVEDEVDDRVAAARPLVERRLQCVELGLAGFAEGHDLAVQPGGLEAHALDALGQRGHAVRPVVAAPRDERHLALLVDAGHEAVAVELDLEEPAALGRHARREGGELRAYLRGQRRLHRARHRGFASRRALGCGALGPRRAQRLGDDAVGQRRDDVVVGRRPGVLIALLEQDPGLLLLAGLGDLHQLPQAEELLAVKAEVQLARLHPLVRVVHRLPGALVPHDHRAGAVLALGDRAFEAAVAQRVILDVDGDLLLGRVEARPLGNGPGQQHAVELEAEVVVQARGSVLLHDEAQRLAALGGLLTSWLGRDREIALGPVARERVVVLGRAGRHGGVRCSLFAPTAGRR